MKMKNKKQQCKKFRDHMEVVSRDMGRIDAFLDNASNVEELGNSKSLMHLTAKLIKRIKELLPGSPEEIRKQLKSSYLALDKLMVDQEAWVDTEVDTSIKKVVVKHDLVLKGKLTKIEDGILPKDILIKGDLTIENLSLNMSIGLVIEGDLRIEDENIRYLPLDIIVHGNAYVKNPLMMKDAIILKEAGQIKGSVYKI